MCSSGATKLADARIIIIIYNNKRTERASPRRRPPGRRDPSSRSLGTTGRKSRAVWHAAPRRRHRRRSFLKNLLLLVVGGGGGCIGLGGRGRGGGQRHAERAHTRARSSFRRRRCPRVTHTHGCACVPNGPPTTHHPLYRADDGREYCSRGVSRGPVGGTR